MLRWSVLSLWALLCIAGAELLDNPQENVGINQINLPHESLTDNTHFIGKREASRRRGKEASKDASATEGNKKGKNDKKKKNGLNKKRNGNKSKKAKKQGKTNKKVSKSKKKKKIE